MVGSVSHMLGLPLRRVVLGLVLVLAAAACGGGESADVGSGEASPDATDATAEQVADEDLGSVRVAMICGGMTPMTAQIAINAETFPEGLEVEKLCFDGGSEAVQALIGGSVDVFMGSTEHVLSTRAKGLPMKAYAGINNRAPYSLLTAADSDVESVEDLEGQTVAVTSPGSLSDTELRKAAEDAGIDYDSMTVIGAGSGASMAAAISQGQVAAGMVSEPQQSELVQSGDYRLVWEPEFDYAAIVAVANSEWVAENEATMSAFLEGLATAAERAKEDTSFAVTAMKAENFPVSDEVLSAAVESGLKAIPENLIISEEVYTATTDVLISVGRLDEAEVADYEEALDFSLLPNA